MFDSVLGRGQGVKSRFGAGASVSLVVHATVFALALYLSSRAVSHSGAESEVKFFSSRPAPPPPPPPPGGNSQPKVEKHVEKKVVKKPDTIIQPREIPTEKPAEVDPPKDEPQSDPAGQVGGEVGGKEGGTVGGQVGGQIGGQLGGQVGGQPGSDVVPFDSSRMRAVPMPGNKPIEYTREALEAHVEGTMLLRCTITTEGAVTNCRILKPVPHMEKQVLRTVESWRYQPVLFEGKPVNTDMLFTFRLVAR